MQVLRHGRWRRYAPGEVVVSPGRSMQHFYLLVEGLMRFEVEVDGVVREDVGGAEVTSGTTFDLMASVWASVRVRGGGGYIGVLPECSHAARDPRWRCGGQRG